MCYILFLINDKITYVDGYENEKKCWTLFIKGQYMTQHILVAAYHEFCASDNFSFLQVTLHNEDI